MHILAAIALVVLVGIYFFFKWLFTAIGLIKPPPIIPSGVAVGEKATRTLGRDTPWAQRHIEALDKMTVITDADNGESWRVLSYTAVIDNQYKFIILRVA